MVIHAEHAALAALGAAGKCERCKGTGVVGLQYGGDGYDNRCCAIADGEGPCPECVGTGNARCEHHEGWGRQCGEPATHDTGDGYMCAKHAAEEAAAQSLLDADADSLDAALTADDGGPVSSW